MTDIKQAVLGAYRDICASIADQVAPALVDGRSVSALVRNSVSTQYENDAGQMVTPARRLTLKASDATWDRDRVRTLALRGEEYQILGYQDDPSGALVSIDIGRRVR